MTKYCCALAAVACVIGLSATPLGAQEPEVELGKVERLGAAGRLFHAEGATSFLLLTRQSYGAEHAVGYTGELRLVTKVGGKEEQKTFAYEIVCNSERKGYRPVRVTEPGKPDLVQRYSGNLENPNRKPKPDMKVAYNLFWAACHKQFGKLK